MVYPTPTLSDVTISFKVYEQGPTALGLYDVNGKQCMEILSGTYGVGQYNEVVDLTNLSPGTYLAVLRREDEIVTRKTQKTN
jgi:hypothetical protein